MYDRTGVRYPTAPQTKIFDMEIQFGGEIIKTQKYKDEIILQYNDNKVFLSKLEEFLNSPLNIDNLTKDLVMYDNGDTVKIGCLSDKKIKFLKLIKLLKKHYGE